MEYSKNANYILLADGVAEFFYTLADFSFSIGCRGSSTEVPTVIMNLSVSFRRPISIASHILDV